MQDNTINPANRLMPGNARLLRGVQATLRKMKKVIGDEQSLMELSAIDFVLSELASRDQRGFYLEHYRAVRQLLAEGMLLLKAKLAPNDAAEIEKALSTTLPQQLEPGLSFDILSAHLNAVKRHLMTFINAARGDASFLDYVQRVSDSDNQFHLQRARFADTRELTEPDNEAPLDAERLTRYLKEKFPQRAGLRVTRFKQLVGGFQKITALFETLDDSGRHDSLVFRSEKNDRFVELDASDIRKEYAIIKFLYDAGATVPEPMWLEDDKTRLGQRFSVSRRVPGENYGSAVVTDKPMTDDVVKSFIEAIARVHMLPKSDEMRRLALGRWLEYKTPQDVMRATINHWREQLWMNKGNPSPILDRLTTWLTDNVPQGDIPLSLIHCDYGPHNVLVDQGKVSGIVDWESARIGDPAEDIAWFLQGCGGKVDFKKVIDWYAEITGHRISEYRLRYFDVIGCLKIMVSSVSAEAMYEHTEEASIVWMILPYRYTSHGTSLAEERIRLAEAVRDR